MSHLKPRYSDFIQLKIKQRKLITPIFAKYISQDPQFHRNCFNFDKTAFSVLQKTFSSKLSQAHRAVMLEKPSTWEGLHLQPSATPPTVDTSVCWEHCNFILKLPACPWQTAIVSASIQLLSDNPNPTWLFPEEKHASLLSSHFLRKIPYSLIQESNTHLSMELFQINNSAWSSYSMLLQNKGFFVCWTRSHSLRLLLILQASVPHDRLFLPSYSHLGLSEDQALGPNTDTPLSSVMLWLARPTTISHGTLPPAASGRWSRARPSKRKPEG